MAILFIALVFLKFFGKIESWWTIIITMIWACLLIRMMGYSVELGIPPHQSAIHSTNS
jgi:hypothetical protein